MNAGKFSPLIGELLGNWHEFNCARDLSLTGDELDINEGNPMYDELHSLFSGESG